MNSFAKSFKDNFNFKDYKVHLLVLVLVIASELIGTVKIDLKVVSFSLLPMLFAIFIGIVLASCNLISPETMKTASPYITIVALFISTRSASNVGPRWDIILNGGAALLLQEFGNLGTVLLSIPIAVFIFKMDRSAIGAGFSISRESNIAIAADRWGLDSPEGNGIMGAYLTGTVLGAVFFSLLSSLFISIGCFSPLAMAMAAGTGSTSMMAAAVAPLIESFPELEGEIQALSAVSNTISSIDGLYMGLLLAIPGAEWLYAKCTAVANKNKAN